jgi:hypothetical protein
MPEWVTWFFDGLGTEIISLIIGVVGGGLIGYRIGKRKSKFIQTQEAGAGSEQHQKGKLVSKSNNDGKKSQDSKSSFRQTQKAGDNSKQTQIGGQDNV